MSLEQVIVDLALGAFWRAGVGEVTETSGKISTAIDLTGNGKDLAQAVAGVRPVRKASWLNGRPSMTFTGVEGLARAENLMTSNINWTMGWVGQITAFTTGVLQFILRTSGLGGTNMSAHHLDGGVSGKRDLFLQGIGSIHDSPATSNPEVWIASRDASALHLYVGLLGAEETLDLPNTAPGGLGGANTSLGAVDSTGAFGLRGEVGEAWFVQRLFMGAERTSYLGYVSQHYWTASASATSILYSFASVAAATERLEAAAASAFELFASDAEGAETLPGSATSACSLDAAAAGTEVLGGAAGSSLDPLTSTAGATESLGGQASSSLLLTSAVSAREQLPGGILSLLAPFQTVGTADELLEILEAPRLVGTLIQPTRLRGTMVGFDP